MTDLRALVLSIAPLLLTLSFMMIGHGLLGTGTAVRLDIDGYSPVAIGMVSAAYAIGFMAGTLVVPRMIGRVGHIRVFAAFACLFIISALLQGLHVDPLSWALLRLVAGFCIAGINTLTESWINEATSNTIRGAVFSIYMACTYFSVGLAQAMFAYTDPASMQIFVVTAILVSLSVLPLSLARIQPPEPGLAPRIPLIRLFRISPLGFASVLTCGLVGSVLANFVPVIAREIDTDNGWIAELMLAYLLTGFLFQLPIGKLSDRADRRLVIIGSAALVGLCGLTGLVLGLPNKTLALLLIGAAGGLIPALYSVGVAHTTDWVDNTEMVAVNAGLLMVFGIGIIIGPMGGGLLLAAIGNVTGTFLSMLVLCSGLVAYGGYRMTARDTVSDKDKGHFQMAPTAQMTPASSLAALELDPRIADEQYSFDLGPAGDVYLTPAAAGLESISDSGILPPPSPAPGERHDPFAA